MISRKTEGRASGHAAWYGLRLWEAPLPALALFAMDALAHLQLRPGEFILYWAAWLVCVTGAAAAGHWGRLAPGWWFTLVQLLVPGLGLLLINPNLRHPWSAGEMAYALLLVAALTAGWRWWLRRTVPAGDRVAAEAVRLLIVGGTAVWVTLPLFTDRWVSGVDARWYAYMLGDFIDQLRAGIFPVLTGQGELAYNGGVHPFRSAPVYLWCAGLWDCLTLRVLPVMSLQHLTAITSALAGGWGMYACVRALAPRLPWMALAVSVIYVTSPGFLGPLYFADQYMTFMLLGALPLLLLGNARMFEGDGRRGLPWLAIGLAAVWFCHPPVAILCSLVTLFIQGGRLLLGDKPGRDLNAILPAVGLFLLLAGHYFLAMGEVPSPLQPSVSLMVIQLAGLALGVVGLVRALAWGERWGWVALAGGGAILWRTQPAWLLPLLIAAGLVAVLSGFARAAGRPEPGRSRGNLVLGAAVAAAFVGPWLWQGDYPAYSGDTLALLKANTAGWRELLLPLTATSGGVGVLQPGWGVLFLLAVLVWQAGRETALRPRLFLAAAFLLAAAFVRVPGLSDFWLAHLPRALTEMAGLPIGNRLIPPFVAFTCVGGALALARLAEKNRPHYHLALAGLLLLASWGGWSARIHVQRGWLVTHTRQDTANQFRPENAVLDRFAYDLMMMPAYVSNGKTDPRLESRLFVRTPEVRIGPDEIARRMEAAVVQEHLVTTTVEPTAPAWLNLAPRLTLAPGEHLLVRFEFLPKDYNGWLIIRSQHTYREYQLPDAGWRHAFGVGRERSKTLSFWNSGATPEEISLSFQRPEASGEFGDFARIFVSPYRPELSPVRTISLRPYRVEVDMPTPGWLETPRAYLPGYVARVNGREVESSLSPRWLMRVPLEAGRQVVELDYRGTFLFRLTWWISTAAWVGVLVWLVRRPS